MGKLRSRKTPHVPRTRTTADATLPVQELPGLRQSGVEGKGEAMNYPWSGKLGRIADCCIHCGDAGSSFQLSSAGERCCYCKSSDTPLEALLTKLTRDAERLAREWCDRNGVDYDAEIRKGPS